MKRITCVSLLTLLLLSLITVRPSAAQTPGAAASGSYKFILEDKLVKYVEFSAFTDDKGVTTGSMAFNDEAKISDRDVDNPDDKGSGDPVPFYMKAEFDTLTVEKNRALMSGTVMDSSVRGYIGRWVQLVVEDNGANVEVPDRVTWRFCQPAPGGWIPSDAERPDDRGAWMSWWATDAERKDDVGIPSKNLMPDQAKRCEVLPLRVYSFPEMIRWDGYIDIRQ